MFAHTESFISGLLILISILFLGACSAAPESPTLIPGKTTQTSDNTSALIGTPLLVTETKIGLSTETSDNQSRVTPTVTPTDFLQRTQYANVLSLHVSGDANAYQFNVEIQSPDTGCDQYADWWEVISEDGDLIYRRILNHSHVSEQPFTRSGGPVAVDQDMTVIVRAHMNPGGYGGTAFRGSVGDGFDIIQLKPDFAADLAQSEPLPAGCGF
jgi:hypothetical protein